MSCKVCHDRGYIQVAWGKSGELQMTNRRCPACSTTEDEMWMAKAERLDINKLSPEWQTYIRNMPEPEPLPVDKRPRLLKPSEEVGGAPAKRSPARDWARKLNPKILERYGKSEKESEAPKVSGHGKLSEHTRSRIGAAGSSKREEMPSHVFLLGAQRKYPVKLKSGDKWAYSPRLLLAAARRARMQGRSDLASRADAIRARLDKGFAPHVSGIREHLLLKSQGFYKSSRLGRAWRWNCSCGHADTAPTEQEAIDQYVMHREEAGIPTGAWGPNMGHHQLREVQDTRDSVKHALPAMQGVPPLAAYMPPSGIMGFLEHHG